MVYDVAIIGTGPAGLAAALTLKAHEKNIVWLGSKKLSDKVELAESVANYPGLIKVSGKEMNEIFRRQIEEMELSIEECVVNQIIQNGENYAIMAGPSFFEAKSVIFATGVAMKDSIKGEASLLGRGVSYCATCDGWLYKGKKIAVISNKKRFEHEVEYLAELAEDVLFLPYYKDVSVQGENVTTSTERVAEMVETEGRISKLIMKNGDEISIDGVFCLRDSVSLGTLLPNLEIEEGHIAVNRKQETNLPGCFAAGDCTGRPYQYTKAVGEGNVAAHSVIDYLASKE